MAAGGDPSTSAATADPPIIFDLPVAPDPNYCETRTITQYGIRFDDGDVDIMNNRSACVEAIGIMDAEIAKGEYDEDDYAGRQTVKRTITTVTTAWEPA